MRFILLCVVLSVLLMRLAGVAAGETVPRAEARIDPASGLLDLNWPAASVHGASFSIEINGARVGGVGEVGRSDAGITQQWKSAVAKIDRQIDLQTAAPAVIVRTRVMNISNV